MSDSTAAAAGGAAVKLIYFSFFINDWVSSATRKRLSRAAIGLYLDLLPTLYQSAHPGYASAQVSDSVVYLTSTEILSDLARNGESVDDLLPLWLEVTKWGCMVKDDLGWYNPKAREKAPVDIRNAQGRKQKAANAANARWNTTSNAPSIPPSNAQAMPPRPEPRPRPRPRPEPEPTDTQAPPSPRATSKAVETVGKAWAEAWEVDGYRVTSQDTWAVNNAVAEGFTVEELVESVQGWVKDDWPKRKQYSAISRLLEDADKVRQGIELARTEEDDYGL